VALSKIKPRDSLRCRWNRNEADALHERDRLIKLHLLDLCQGGGRDRLHRLGALLIESNEVLMKARVVPRRSATGEVEFVGAGRKTVDIQQIKERFESWVS
jgi:hypothetical protein